MRWFWIDRFEALVSGQYAVAVKNVSAAEPQMQDHFASHPVMPTSLVIEGMAQTGGLLVSEYNDFRERVVLAKLAKSKFYCYAAPGDTLHYRATIQQIHKDGAMVRVTSHLGDVTQGEVELFFAHLSGRAHGRELFEPSQFLNWLKAVRIFHVGRKADGSPLCIPPHLKRHESGAAPSADPVPSQTATP